jgi:hypothetical protein
MTSSYTANNGLEKPDTGDQEGAWGGTLNTNFDIIDRVLSGVGSISLSGTTHTLTTTDGTLTDGMYRVLLFTGALGANNTVTISPNDQDKLYFVVNSTTDSGSSGPYSVIVKQGTGATVTVANGAFDIVYADGAGAGAAVTSLLSKKLSTGAITTSGNIVIPDSGNIGSASDTDAMAISSGGVVAFSAVPTFPNDTIETADIQDNAVTLAKMAGLARGKIIYGDASGDPAALAVGSANYVLKSDGTDIAWAANTATVALDDIATGDAASTLATTTGNITIDAQANDADVIIKVDDAGASVTAVTFDGSDEGNAIFVNDIQLKSDSAVLEFGSDLDVTVTHNADKGLTLNSKDISGVKSINGTDSGSGANYGQIGGKRNMIYNGDMAICQRATSVSGVGNGDNGYHVQDRWKFYEAGSPAAVVTWSQSTTTPDGFYSSLKMDCTTASGTVGADDFFTLSQLFEGQDLQGWNKGNAQARSVTISFWVNTTKTGTYIVNLLDNDNSRMIAKSYTVSSADTWEYKTITFEGDTTGAFGNDNAISLYVYWGLVCGSNYTSGTLATSWAAYDATNRFVGQVDAFDSTSNNFHITGVQMELGDTASAFEYESYGENLARCQRYFYKGEDAVYGSRVNTYAGYANVWFPTTMRADPTVTGVNSASTAQGVSRNRIDCYAVGGYPNFDAGHTASAEL